MSKHSKLATTVLEIVPPPAVVPAIIAPSFAEEKLTSTDQPSTDPILGPAHVAGEFAVCADTKGLAVAPILSYDVLYNVVNDGNGTAAAFRGVLNGRAYFSEQKYATRLRHANERASTVHTDGTAPAVVQTRRAKYVDMTGILLADLLQIAMRAVAEYSDTTLRVPREVCDIAVLCEPEKLDGYKADFLASAVTDAQDALRAFGRTVNREAGERTAPENKAIGEALARDLRNAHDLCSADAAECTVGDVRVVREELAVAWDQYRAASTVRKAALVDLSF